MKVAIEKPRVCGAFCFVLPVFWVFQSIRLGVLACITRLMRFKRVLRLFLMPDCKNVRLTVKNAIYDDIAAIPEAYE